MLKNLINNIELDELMDELDEFVEDKQKDKLNILIIGAASLMLRNVNARATTMDIDLFMTNSNYDDFGSIESIIGNGGHLNHYFNSDGYFILQEMLYFTPREEFYEFESKSYSSLKIHFLSYEAMIAFKVISYSDSNKERQKDLLDIKKILEVKDVDVNKVFSLIDIYCEKSLRVHSIENKVRAIVKELF